MSDLTSIGGVTVPASALQTQIDTAIGQALPAVGGLLTGYGLLTPQHWALWAAAVPIVVSAVWRIWAATRRHSELKALAADPRVPDSVARVG